MEYINEINITEAVLHILDNSSDEPILNEYKLQLNEDVYVFIAKHIERCLKDEELRYALFNEERNIVKEVSQQFLHGQMEFIEVSKEIAKQLFILMKGNGNIPSCDLLVVSVSTEQGAMLAILKMDYVKNYTHTVDYIENKVGINIVPEMTGLPVSSQKIQKCAFIRPVMEEQQYNLLIIDKQSKGKDNGEYGTNYFLSKYLGCTITTNDRDMTKGLVKAAEEWTRANLSENAEAAEFVRTSVKRKLKEEDSIEVNKLSEEMFGENKDVKESFDSFVTSQGIDQNINVDKQWVEKKLKRVRLKIDKDIDLYINEGAYHDNQRFEIHRVGDGSINILLKNVKNYIEK